MKPKFCLHFDKACFMKVKFRSSDVSYDSRKQDQVTQNAFWTQSSPTLVTLVVSFKLSKLLFPFGWQGNFLKTTKNAMCFLDVLSVFALWMFCNFWLAPVPRCGISPKPNTVCHISFLPDVYQALLPSAKWPQWMIWDSRYVSLGNWGLKQLKTRIMFQLKVIALKKWHLSFQMRKISQSNGWKQ